MKITPRQNSLLFKILCQNGKLRNQSKKEKVEHTEEAGELPPRRYCGKYPGEDGELI